MTEQFTIGNRLYQVTDDQAPVGQALENDLRRRGFDGKIYFATSKPVGRQRKTFYGMFYRSAKTQEFIVAG